MNGQAQIDPVQALLAQTALKNTQFAANSRYYGIDTATIRLADGRDIAYVRRRFLPQPDQFQVIERYTVVQGDRLDNIAAKYLGDPTLFWRLADANNAMRAEESIETIGRTLNITLPQGITGAPV
jgi:nucleoid-associated protein YgaU